MKADKLKCTFFRQSRGKEWLVKWARGKSNKLGLLWAPKTRVLSHLDQACAPFRNTSLSAITHCAIWRVEMLKQRFYMCSTSTGRSKRESRLIWENLAAENALILILPIRSHLRPKLTKEWCRLFPKVHMRGPKEESKGKGVANTWKISPRWLCLTTKLSLKWKIWQVWGSTSVMAFSAIEFCQPALHSPNFTPLLANQSTNKALMWNWTANCSKEASQMKA